MSTQNTSPDVPEFPPSDLVCTPAEWQEAYNAGYDAFSLGALSTYGPKGKAENPWKAGWVAAHTAWTTRPVEKPAARSFATPDVLTVYTERYLCDRNMTGVYELLKFMVGVPVYTHHIPAALDLCKPALLKQHPQFSSIDVTRLSPETANDYLAELLVRFGPELLVSPLDSPATVLQTL